MGDHRIESSSGASALAATSESPTKKRSFEEAGQAGSLSPRKLPAEGNCTSDANGQAPKVTETPDLRPRSPRAGSIHLSERPKIAVFDPDQGSTAASCVRECSAGSP
jgi:hypothetical protein